MRRNSNIHSQRGGWEQGRSPVGRVALIPTLIYLPKLMVVQWKFSYQLLISMKHLFYTNLRWDEDNPTYGFLDIKSLSARLSFMPILFFGALENSTLRNFLKYDNLTNFSLKLFFNVKLLTKLQGF